ncbi:hypothetical protein PV392_16275 [Streptomyces sp. ME03-5709C]|nr:hypothetical protein [Streptomyces sp. ME03-5709C]
MDGGTGGADCATMRGCISAGNGVTYNPATGVVAALISPAAGNNLQVGPQGLYVPTGAATITTGCGLTGNGSGANPARVNSLAWPYACAAETAGGVVSCDANGNLRSEPRAQLSFVSFSEQRDYANLTVPSGTDVVADTFSTTFTNPDACRPAMLLVEREADVDFNLPAGAGAAYGQDTDEVYYVRNSGSSAISDAHSQTTKLYMHTASVPPGGSATVTFPVTLGRGSSGATYNRIQVFIRGLMISH